MKYLLIIMAAMVFFSCNNNNKEPKTSEEQLIQWPENLPRYDHIVIVVEENKDYHEIIPVKNTPPKDSITLVDSIAPYINKTLRTEGANFTNMYGEEHFSQGNYFWLFSGSNQNVGFMDQIPNSQNNPNYPFTAPNLASQLLAKNLSFKGYSESLPFIGSDTTATNESGVQIYGRKHVPWISFSNVPNGKTVGTSCNLRFMDFPPPSEYDKLPLVSFVIPNLDNDMHNCSTDQTECISKGDKWLKDNLDSYYQWAKTNNSLLIVTFDENDDLRKINGLTDPAVDPESAACKSDRELCVDRQNKVVTIFAGAHILPGDYPEGKGITHVNILRTIEAMYGLPKAGAQQPNAAAYGISDDYIISDIFEEIK